jgi:histone H3/H4
MQYTQAFAAEYKKEITAGRWTRSARDALHEVLENFAVEMFQDAVLVTANSNRSTTTLGDLVTANMIKRIPREEHDSVEKTAKKRAARVRKERVKAYSKDREAVLAENAKKLRREQREALRRKARGL